MPPGWDGDPRWTSHQGSRRKRPTKWRVGTQRRQSVPMELDQYARSKLRLAGRIRRADNIKWRSQASRGEGTEMSSAAEPLVPMEPGAAPHEALLWPTRIASEAEEIMNATLLLAVMRSHPATWG